MYILGMANGDSVLKDIFMKFGVEEHRSALLVDNLVLTSHVEACSNLAKSKDFDLVSNYPEMMSSTPEEIYKFMVNNWDANEVDTELKKVSEELGFLVMQKVMQEQKLKVSK